MQGGFCRYLLTAAVYLKPFLQILIVAVPELVAEQAIFGDETLEVIISSAVSLGRGKSTLHWI